jgi:hypothetical protein
MWLKRGVYVVSKVENDRNLEITYVICGINNESRDYIEIP